MSFYLRSSIKVGPFRCGLSRSGLSVSTGVPGLRVGAGPRGAFVRVGAAGVYSYLTVPTTSRSRSARRAPVAPPAALAGSDIALQDVTGASVAELAPAAPSELVESLNAAARRHRLWPWVLVVGLVLAVAVSPFVLLVAAPVLLLAVWRDRVRRSVVIFYEVNDAPAARFARLVHDFAVITSSEKGWHSVAQGALRTTHQRKVHAGAGTVVRRETLTRTLTGPPHLAANIAIPTLQSSSRSVYLLPDRALVRDGSRYTELSYDALTATAGPDRFIETGRVPSDATVVDTTWKYVNKKGGPDKRFKDNRQLPVVRYGEVALSTATGMKTVLSFSRFDAAPILAAAIQRMDAPAQIPHQRQAPTQPPRNLITTAPQSPTRPRELPARLPHPVRPDPTHVPTGSVTGGRRRALPVEASTPPTTTWTPTPLAANATLVHVSGEGRMPVVGESHYQPALTSAAAGRAAGYEIAEHISARAVLVPEPTNPHDRNAVRVDVLTPDGAATAGYLAREVAPEYHDLLAALGPGRFATCDARITGGGPDKFYGLYLHLARPADLLPPTRPAGGAHRVTLAPETACTVTGEEHHQDHLRSLLSASPAQCLVVAELGWCRIATGKYTGQTAIEVRVQGERVGQLTYAMTQRYTSHVRGLEQNGRRATAEATIFDSLGGVQIELRIPRAR